MSFSSYINFDCYRVTGDEKVEKAVIDENFSASCRSTDSEGRVFLTSLLAFRYLKCQTKTSLFFLGSNS